MITPAANRPILWLDPTFGASGDMVLGALVGLGAPLDTVVDGLQTLPVDGWTMAESTVTRGSLTSTRVEVTADQGHHHRTWTSIDAMLADSDLPAPVTDGARRTFRALGEAEAAIHGVSIDDVHFHEVGAVDAIVDIVGGWLALHLLSPGSIVCGPFGLGHGVVSAAHGALPLPAPATAAMLRNADVHPVDVAGETVTPTGAALLTTMAADHGPFPAGRLTAVARGAGGRNPDSHPNVISAYLIEPDPAPGPTPDPAENSDPATGDRPRVGPAIVLQTNLDDVTGEVVAHTINRCLEAGADDAWATTIVMKKGRPGVELNVLTNPDRIGELSRIISTETGSLGIRHTTVTKMAQPRRFDSVDVDGQSITIKVGPHGAKPEYDDLAAAAQALGRPVRVVSEQALDRYRRRS